MKIWFFVFCTITLYSAPAREVYRVFTQHDGTKFEAKQRGDEYLHWLEGRDGSIIIYNKKSDNFEVGIIDVDELKPSGTIYTPKSRSSRCISAHALDKLWQKKRQAFRH